MHVGPDLGLPGDHPAEVGHDLAEIDEAVAPAVLPASNGRDHALQVFDLRRIDDRWRGFPSTLRLISAVLIAIRPLTFSMLAVQAPSPATAVMTRPMEDRNALMVDTGLTRNDGRAECVAAGALSSPRRSSAPYHPRRQQGSQRPGTSLIELSSITIARSVAARVQGFDVNGRTSHVIRKGIAEASG